ncbi:hypothetical protein VTN96DRAFT_369 [Rasamsonia emersonii]|uniref:Dihydrofolate synthetase n=1 Tax=Rasamsonia emersonii (strain ATCC 16479 / CBS 393.64 / IMI 116815) TaxID=1408163 RepID=A0A0F4YJR3_RASE3|nr:Tetrahydrofolate synthase [Rasamsonia emersonii CBS 393.64]KKA17828.1 Tetrahydrofolate synthase [Rasamsonia emersonii CBS 393.64]
MIELGLSRISRLVQQSPLLWKAVHVAGTNGKGSITAYVSGLLAAGGVRCGRFTSPHLINRWDCITIDEEAVQESLFRQVEDQVKQRDKQLGLGATEFELLTATAFEIFNRERVEVGVVEVGMGGRLDATNILSNVLVSVISKIGLDHEAFLGNSIKAIAREKAGILKSGVPCVIDGTNSSEVLDVLQSRIRELGIDAVVAHPETIDQRIPELARLFKELDLEPHQKANMSCAVIALQKALEQIRPEKKVEDLLPTLSQIRWPGRLQQISLRPLVAREEPVLLDGAHNGQSADVLGKYVDRRLRQSGRSVTWIVAASHGKDISEIFEPLIRPGDSVAVVAFGPVDGMPWIKATDTAHLSKHIQSTQGVSAVKDFDADLLGAMNWASTVADGGPLVIAGSLYLVSDVLRLLGDKRPAL